MVVYFPHCGSFQSALQKKKEFIDLVSLSLYLQGMYGKDNIYYKYYCFDYRIEKPVFMVCVCSYMGENYIELYNCPQCFGYFYFDEKEN